MDANSIEQRKIELQSPEDLTYLIANVRRAAAVRLNEAFPLVEGEDELRERIERLVNEYIDKTYTLAAPNLSINGLPVQPKPFLQSTPSAITETAYEPFDTRKRQKIADLTTQEERLLEDVAALKRSVPSRSAADYSETLKTGIASDEEALRMRVEGAKNEETERGLKDVDGLERQGDVEDSWRGAVEGLGRLKKDMPAVVARMERARVAGEYVMKEAK